MKIKFTLLLLLSCLKYFCAYSQIKLLSISNGLENSTDSVPWINQNTAVKGNAHSGEYFSSTDSMQPYGLGYKGLFPEKCRNKNLRIKLSEFVRTNKTGTKTFTVITVSYKDSIVVWNSKNVAGRIKSPNEWTKIEEEIDLPASLTGENYTLAIYLWNSDGGATVDMDDFAMDFEEKEMPSFLPTGFQMEEVKDGWQKMTSNQKFNFYYNKFSGQVRIQNAEGDTIINSLAFYTEWFNKESKEPKQTWNYHFYLKKDSVAEEGNYFMFNARDEITENEITILAGLNGNLSFSIVSEFISSVTLSRHSIATGFVMPLVQIYKKSTLIDSINFKKEYWLDKEGFALSNGKRAVVLYHPSEISSLQFDVKNNLAIINLDYSADHPLLHFPLLKKSANKFVDHSTSVYAKGDRIKSFFSIQTLKSPLKTARLLTNPYGFLSSFTWTEHADYTNLRTHKAVYLGSEKINRLNDATGGFLKYSIPVTKSIFYANPDKVDNSEKGGFMKGPIASYKETEGYSDFLKLLYESNIEICLHTPDHYTCDRKLLTEALEKTKKEFYPTTWIDHGYDNSSRSNREDLACDGSDSTSKWYSADLWKRYGIKYFWNSFYEDSGIFKDYSFNSFFSVPYSGWDDGFPTPLYWRNKTRTGNLVHWRTTDTMDPEDGSLWSYYFNDLRIKDLINNRNNIIVHCYPARVDSTTGFYSIKDGVVVANDDFNKALQKLSSYRSEENLRLTTIRELLDYRTSIENVYYEIEEDGKILIQNKGRELIRGLSFITLANEVKAGAKEIIFRKYGDELIFWFDISPGEIVNLTLK